MGRLWGEAPSTLPKVRGLLAYLAVESERLHLRRALAALFWPDSSEQAALASLRSALSNLRRAIGDGEANPPYLLITHETVQFNRGSDFRLDAADLLRQTSAHPHPPPPCRPGDIEPTIAAVDGYRGPFLAGFSIPDSAAFEEWASLWRERLGQCMLEGLRRLSDFYEACGDFSLALAFARRLVAHEP